MSWRSVIVSQHAKISYSSRQLVVQTRDGTNYIPIDDIQFLIVCSNNVVITTAALNNLVSAGSKVVFSDNKGEPSCEVIGYFSNNRSVNLLKKQFLWNQDKMNKLWTELVTNKIGMQISVCRKNNSDTSELEKELSKVKVGDTTNREAVVARKYFNLIFGGDFKRRDSDVVNGALNYGYSILLSAINREIAVNGYLVQLGIHHHSEQNDFNLGSDLMEPFRPFFDYWVAAQNFSELTPDIKFALVDLLNIKLKYNGECTILRNAISKHVQNCLNFLSEENSEIKMKVELSDEVSNNEIASYV